MQILFLERTDLQLSKTVLGIKLRPLNHFLHIFEFWSIFEKMMIFAILGLWKFFRRTLKIVLEVAATFPERFWKAEGPYFSKMKFASTKLRFFTPFRNQNGIIQKLSRFYPENACIPFGLQKCPNFKFELRDVKYGP